MIKYNNDRVLQNIIYAWEATGDNYNQQCSICCIGVLSHIVDTCKAVFKPSFEQATLTGVFGEFDSHTTSGDGDFNEACGQWIIEIMPES